MGFFDVFAYVDAQISIVIGWVIGALTVLAAEISALLSQLWANLVALANWAFSIFQKVGAFFSNLWTNFLKPLWARLVALYTSIRTRLQAIFGPILAWINRIRAWYFQYIYPWVQLVQEILSRIRVILTVFRILGAKWAAKLDSDIQRIQGYITEVQAGIISALNQAITWINIAIDPAGILRKDFFTGTLFGSLGALKNAAQFGNGRQLTGTEQVRQQQDLDLAKGGAAVLTRNADGSVALSAASQRILDSGNQAVDYYGRAGPIH